MIDAILMSDFCMDMFSMLAILYIVFAAAVAIYVGGRGMLWSYRRWRDMKETRQIMEYKPPQWFTIEE